MNRIDAGLIWIVVPGGVFLILSIIAWLQRPRKKTWDVLPPSRIVENKRRWDEWEVSKSRSRFDSYGRDRS